VTGSKFDVTKFLTLVFDCDGVLLNSNKIKTEAFFKVASRFGEKYARRLVQYHVSNGGISRYQKFNYFFSEILGQKVQQSEVDYLVKEYGEYVVNLLLSSEVVSGLVNLRLKTKKSRWMIVSGGDQVELNRVFTALGLADMFDGGIYGSPLNKEEIFQRALNDKTITQPCVFFGDSKYDYQTAKAMQLDFVFISGWTEVKDWESFCADNNIASLNRVTDVLFT
jgi:HAD superfamily hydrolase (TIGR01549 family)